MGARHRRADGAARPTSTASCATPARTRPDALWAVVSQPRDGGGVDAEVVDEAGRVRVRLEGYRTIELPGGFDDDALAPIRAAMGGD